MSPTRRLFLQDAVVLVVAAAFPLNGLAQDQAPEVRDSFDPENLAIFDGVSPHTFEPWIGSGFRAWLNGKTRGSLQLSSVEANESPGTKSKEGVSLVRASRLAPEPLKRAEISSFSLRFQRTGSPLPQGTYLMEHDWLGTFPLFLVPSGISGQTSTCTAVFSLLSQPRGAQ